MSAHLFDVEARNELAHRAGLVRDEALAEQALGSVLDLHIVLAQLDAARLTARTRMDLRLDDPFVAADFRRAIVGLLGTVGDASTRNWHAKLRKQLLSLILVNVHGDSP